MKTVIAILSVALLAGCTTVDPEALSQAKLEKQERRAELIAEQGFVVGEKLDRIDFPRFLDSWGYIDDQAIWLEARPRRFYLVTISFPCPDLAFTQAIGLKSRAGTNTYLTELDEIVFERQRSGTCQIDAIYEMTRQRSKKEKEPEEQPEAQ